MPNSKDHQATSQPPRRWPFRHAATKVAASVAALLLSVGLNSAHAAQSEVLLNRGFENGSAPWVVGYWGGSSVTIEATPEVPAHSGSYMRHLSGTCSAGFFNATAQGLGSGNGTIGIPAGAVFHASAWFRCPDAATTPCEVRVRPRCNSGVGASIIYTLTDNDWHFVGDDGTGAGITMPSNDWLDLRLYGPSDRDVYVDDAKVLVDYSAITGTVVLSDATDPTGTTLTLKDASDVVLGSTVIDNPGGAYSIPVATGTYSVTASRTGYFSNLTSGITMEISDVAAPAITLAAKTSYTITASAEDNGTISPSGSLPVYEGDSQLFTFTPAIGYLADQVTIDGVPETASPAGYTFSDITSSHSIAITFTVDPFVRFNFDTTLQGWANLGGGTDTFISRTGGDMGAGQTTPNFAGIDNWDNRDACTSTLWLRSPSFAVEPASGDLTFYRAGGSGAGIGALPTTVDAAVVQLGDMPGVGAPLLNRLMAAFSPVEGRAICVPTVAGKRGNPVLWARRFFPEMAKLSGDSGAKHLIGEHADLVCEVEMTGEAAITDIDTPEALAAWRARVPA